MHLLTHRGQSKSSDDAVSPSTPLDTWKNLIDGSPLSSWNDPNKTRLINWNACLLKYYKILFSLEEQRSIWITCCGYWVQLRQSKQHMAVPSAQSKHSYISQKQAGIYNWSEPKWVSDWRQHPERKRFSPRAPCWPQSKQLSPFSKSPKSYFAASKKEEESIQRTPASICEPL